CRERMYLFVAEGVEAGDARPEDDEELELVHWGVGEIAARIGELEDAKSIAGLLLYLSHEVGGPAVKIGVAQEIKTDQDRGALTPAGARELIQHGHDVVVESGAGAGSAFSDAAYEAAGARIASVDDVWADAELLLKVKEPIAPEYEQLREGLVLFTYLHIAADEPLTRALVDRGIAAVAYETVETNNGALPLLAPMSEVAGRLAAQAGAYFLEKPLGGRGLLLGGVPGVAPGRVVVIGGGMVGYNAA